MIKHHAVSMSRFIINTLLIVYMICLLLKILAKVLKAFCISDGSEAAIIKELSIRRFLKPSLSSGDLFVIFFPKK